MPRFDNPISCQVLIMSALLAVLPGVNLAQDRPGVALPPPSLYDDSTAARPSRAERSEADTPLRDVAGMLRSFDYVAGTLELEDDDPSGRAWADTARAAFLEGYAHELGTPLTPHARLLAALELDKALYECVYEVRNRPAWLPIPERAVHRLVRRNAS